MVLMSVALRALAALALTLGLFALSPAMAGKPPPTAPAKTALPPEPEMSFIIVRDDANGCEPSCSQWIEAQGQIMTGTPAKLARLLANPANRKLPLLLNSNGGKVYAALEMGHMIRRYGMTTAVGRTHFDFCDPFGDKGCIPTVSNRTFRGSSQEFGARCLSACPFIMLGGTTRLLGPLSYLGLHQPKDIRRPYIDHYWETWRMVHGHKVILSRKFINRTNLPTKTVVGVSPEIRKRLTPYIKEMGASSKIMDEMELAGPDAMYQIKTDLAQELGLSTKILTGLSSIAGDELCSASPAPANCVTLK